MKHLFLILIVVVCSSCTFFETEKISSERFYEEEIKTINWNDVDTYPVFNSCSSLTEKQASKQCFFNTLNSEIVRTVQQHNLVVYRDVVEKVLVHIAISENGKMEIDTIEIDSITSVTFPKLESWIRQSVAGLETPLPALKRGIPVKTKVTLPVILKTN